MVEKDINIKPVLQESNNILKDGDLISKMKDKITEQKEYIKPPSYERVGRGLVYNCAGKHWACVNKRSYFSCKGKRRMGPI